MRIFDYLDKLRARPLEERKKILVVWTGFLMIVVVLIWVANTFWLLTPVDNQTQVSTTSVSQLSTESNFLSKLMETGEAISTGVGVLVDLVRGQNN